MALKSCTTCPSLMTEQPEIGQRFGRAPNASVCGRYGHLLNVPTNPEAHTVVLRQHYALSCDSHGEPLPAVATPVTITTKVKEPVESFLPVDPDDVPNCNGCKHCVKSNVVEQMIGVPVAMCGIKGSLIYQPRVEAKGCQFAQGGTPSDTFPGRPMPELWPTFSLDSSIVLGQIIDSSSARDEPSTYESDKEVTEFDDAVGIRAWRRVEDPDGTGNHTYLPIFRRDFFTEEDQIFIPFTGSNEHPEGYIDYAGLLYQFAIDSFVLGETLCLVGPAGVGKTEFARWVAYLMQVPFHRFTFTKATEVDDMIGKVLFDPERGTYWHDGRLTKAYSADAAISLWDEFNLGPEETREFARPMIDNSSQLVLDSGLGEIRSKGRHSYILMAINPSHDMRNLGTADLADAETNRMSFSLVGYPPAAVEKQIIREACARDGYDITADTLEKLIAIAEDIRAASDTGEYPGTWGVRQQIMVARKTRWYALPRAYQQTALNYIDPAEAEIILSSIATHDG